MVSNAQAFSPTDVEVKDAPIGPRRLRFLDPLVDRVARVPISVHTKLLAGFLLTSLFLMAMAVISVLVLERVDSQVDRLTELQAQTDRARRMIYDVTAQSHFRAMAFLEENNPEWTPKIDGAKERFDDNLEKLQASPVPVSAELYSRLEENNERYRASGVVVETLFSEGETRAGINLHVTDEHEISHDLEGDLNALIAEADQMLLDETAAFDSDRRFLTATVALFSGASLIAALGLGAILSWSLINPVRRVDEALEAIADGDFERRVTVPNRDEFGTLTANLNRTTTQLATLYKDLETLNQNLQQTVDDKVVELERASVLKRYVSPQLASSILSGDIEVELGSKRKYLTTFFSDIRGFTSLSERMEPEEMVAELNDYLTSMTEIVFEFGGTLDKYIGDAVMVFFGDPVEQDDHADRAVRMAIAMQDRMTELHDGWRDRYDELFSIGIGISTGWVTVGNIGSNVRTDYTVLGNHVNLAARLADRAQSNEILLTERTLRSSKTAHDATMIDEISFKGVSRPTKIYRLELNTETKNGSDE